MGFMMLTCPVTGDADLDRLAKIKVSSTFLYCKVTILPFVANKYLGGDTLRECKSCFSTNFCPLLLVSISGCCLQHYYYCDVVQHGDYS